MLGLTTLSMPRLSLILASDGLSLPVSWEGWMLFFYAGGNEGTGMELKKGTRKGLKEDKEEDTH